MNSSIKCFTNENYVQDEHNRQTGFYYYSPSGKQADTQAKLHLLWWKEAWARQGKLWTGANPAQTLTGLGSGSFPFGGRLSCVSARWMSTSSSAEMLCSFNQYLFPKPEGCIYCVVCSFCFVFGCARSVLLQACL